MPSSTMLWRGATFICLLVASIPALAETLRYQPPAFTEANRRQKIEALASKIDKIYRDAAVSDHLPGVVYGIVLDGELIQSGSIGQANLQQKIPATTDSAFRIASMSKSFVSMAILKLRDDGKLRLDDPVEKYLPEFRQVRPPTSDSPEVTIRHLMTMNTGLPEDNPWGDRQMAITREALRKFVRGGLSFSNPPGQTYEYSNLGFVLLGQVVSKAAGTPFQKYITTKILMPLGMKNTRWEFDEVPADKLALGYRWEHDTWTLEPMLHDGDGAACGGLITTLNDFARYVAFHLNAWPARDEADRGPVRRATLREMHKPSVFSGISPRNTLLDGKTLNPLASFYGYGLGWSVDSRQVVSLAHSGGLPGFGSYYRFLPDYGVAVIAFANRTYAPMSRISGQVVKLLLEEAALQPRQLLPSAILETRKRQVAELIVSWAPSLSDEITAENFFLDRSREDWIKSAQETLAKAGKILSIGPIQPENQLRGSFLMQGQQGRVSVHFTLTPENTPKVQELTLRFLPGF